MSTLDAGLQRRLESVVPRDLAALGGALQAGLVVITPSDGRVRALLGGLGTTDIANSHVNIVVSKRHPGSALKRFVYALALEQGHSPASIAADSKDVASSWQPHHWPKAIGFVRYRESLAGSMNLAAVHVLEDVGTEALVDRLRTAGLGALIDSQGRPPGPNWALGTRAVSLLDLGNRATITARVDHERPGAT
ncbi:MAG: penicillin-binding transpeptidase domain-containing protein [Deltaproteobacteria bacterium]|nr:penicillin-binding transpeptidase domain-containing protein [Deltaproteobacteria bacterium]